MTTNCYMSYSAVSNHSRLRPSAVLLCAPRVQPHMHNLSASCTQTRSLVMSLRASLSLTFSCLSLISTHPPLSPPPLTPLHRLPIAKFGMSGLARASSLPPTQL